MTEHDLYHILGIAPDATPAEIKAAFHRKAMVAHPDHGGDAAAFHRLKMVHDILIDAESRRQYDASRGTPAPRPGEFTQDDVQAATMEVMIEALEGLPSPRQADLLDRMRAAIGIHLRAMDTEITGLHRHADSLFEVANRVQRHDGENALRQLVFHRREDILRTIETVERRSRLYGRVLEFLAPYSYYRPKDTIMISTDTYYKPGG
jgi:curved DNA-binding protein CbpA